jgi:hypothetical protein
MSLGATFELGFAPGRTTTLIGKWTHRSGGYPDLTLGNPPRSPGFSTSSSIHGTLTVVDALRGDGRPAYRQGVERWARSVWDSWADHHDTILGLLGEHGLI